LLFLVEPQKTVLRQFLKMFGVRDHWGLDFGSPIEFGMRNNKPRIAVPPWPFCGTAHLAVPNKVWE
jgi:hypothetical protein